jgi:hypothetical protein
MAQVEDVMRLYVCRLTDHDYAVTTNYIRAVDMGEIVEQWPLDTLGQCEFVGQHGSAFSGAAEKVSKIGYAMAAIRKCDPGFRCDQELGTLTFWQRMKALFA